MKDGFIKVAAATPSIRVADCVYNTSKILELIKKAQSEDVKLLVLPELCVTGYTCGDLFFQQALIESSREAVGKIVESVPKDLIVIFGCPVEFRGKLFNCACVANDGRILGLVPKVNIPNYQEFYECRWFTPALSQPQKISFAGYDTVLFNKLIFACNQIPLFRLSVEICEDIWVPNPPSVSHVVNGATVIANLSASDEFAGKSAYRSSLICGQSARLICSYIYADAGEGESTSDLVFVGHNMICEDGEFLAQHRESEDSLLISEIDVKKIDHERKLRNTFGCADDPTYIYVPFDMDLEQTVLTRKFEKFPFVPEKDSQLYSRCNNIIRLQALALKRRFIHTGSKTAVIGLSGGLDSTLALLVTVKSFEMLSKNRKDIIAVTMPCFGTTSRTRSNAEKLAQAYGCTLRVIDIKDAVDQHFSDIGHDPEVHNVVYENSQARERTQILMDIANELNGLVIGTGDLSELALGWATFNGDHMSNYAVNAGVPKTLVRALVTVIADNSSGELAEVLHDIVDTPVSPELLPSDPNGRITQNTENIVGPYELHDFFLYHMLRWGHAPSKIFRMACYAFQDTYAPEIIEKWLRIFYRRFFTQQFKRSCMPDGPKVGSVALSPRGDLRMPSDACMAIWMDDLEEV
ncbi:MAG: NAD(+) synthase [Sphaerochaetaceae bacterium]|nr:NAD(+) synthase [Sphaerochaetaceae bacterium]MDD3162594.1 NAD(+) synthase [Sphaerochaetaceae bacterium]MDD4006513.1 NAD(+) synthase [Sphaerochaetaceae bacterium]MDD4395950.1 NAD(+) synthase [Sphaerochaetaceae bacterium]